jgi:copper chaperone CopZ
MFHWHVSVEVGWQGGSLPPEVHAASMSCLSCIAVVSTSLHVVEPNAPQLLPKRLLTAALLANTTTASSLSS